MSSRNDRENEDNKALYVISTSESQIYELVAGTSSERNTWKDLLEKTIASATKGANTTKQPSPAPSSGVSSSASRLDISLSEGSVSLEPDSVSDDECSLTPIDKSEACHHKDGQSNLGTKAGVAEAALQDVETLRQLIFRDLEDGWSQDSDDTPTNETATNESPFADRLRTDISDPEFKESPSKWLEDHIDAPPLEVVVPTVQVVRKVVGVGSSIPDDISDDVTSNQSSEERGNMFYLVMPKDQAGALTDESSTDEIKDSDMSHEIQNMSSTSFFDEEEQETPCLSPTDQSLPDNLGQEELGQSQVGIQRHVIKNVDEIFHTIEELMRKLNHLRNIEADHYKLLKKLSMTVPVDKASGDFVHTSPAAVRIPSLDHGAGNGKEGISTEPAQPEIQSTGF